MRTISGFLGVLIIPDANTIRIMQSCVLTHRKLRKRLAKAAYVVKPEGAHVTLYQSRYFKGLPVNVAKRTLELLRTSLVGALESFELATVAPDAHSKQYLFWQVRKNEALNFAHAISVSLGAWTDRSMVESAIEFEDRIKDRKPWEIESARSLNTHERRYGFSNVGEHYQPHITLAADPTAFRDLKTFSDNDTLMLAGVERVVLARMGEWGKIEEILF